MARRRGKSSSKQDDGLVLLEPSVGQSRGINNYVLPGALVLFILVGGLALGWFCSVQQQAIDDLSETMSTLQSRVTRLQQQLGTGSAQLASVGGFEERVLALEEAYAKAQRQAEVALAASEQIKSNDLQSKVWALQTEMTSKFAELQQNTISITTLNAIIKNKSDEFEAVKRRVSNILSTNSELAFSITGLTSTLSVTEARLEEHISVVGGLMSQMEDQKREISEMKESFISSQEALAMNAQGLMDIEDLLKLEQVEKTLTDRSLEASTDALQSHRPAQLEAEHSQFLPGAQHEEVQGEQQEDTTDGKEKAPKEDLTEAQVEKDEESVTERQEVTEEEENPKEQGIKEEERVTEEHRVQKGKETAEEQEQEEPKEQGTSEEEAVPEHHGAQDKEDITEEHAAIEEVITEHHGAQDKEDITEEHAAIEEVITEQHVAREENVPEQQGAIEEETITEEQGVTEEEAVTEEHDVQEEADVTEEQETTAENELTEKEGPREEEQLAKEPEAKTPDEFTEEHRAAPEETKDLADSKESETTTSQTEVTDWDKTKKEKETVAEEIQIPLVDTTTEETEEEEKMEMPVSEESDMDMNENEETPAEERVEDDNVVESQTILNDLDSGKTEVEENKTEEERLETDDAEETDSFTKEKDESLIGTLEEQDENSAEAKTENEPEELPEESAKE